MSDKSHQQKKVSKRSRHRVRKEDEPSATDLIEEGMYLLRQTSLNVWAIYLCGAGPFVFGVLFFWTEMISSGLAAKFLMPGSLALGALFIWFKLIQAYFFNGVRKILCQTPGHAWTIGNHLKVLRRQAFWQSTGLIVLPIAFVITIPFAWIFAFYQNVLMADPLREDRDRDMIKESRKLAKLWPEQNWILISLLGIVYLLSFVNWLTLLMTVPFLLKTFLGIETVFSRSGTYLLNTSSLFVCLLLAYVVTDPLVKAVYLLRRHYCESRFSGADLLLRLRRSLKGGAFHRGVVIAAAFFVAVSLLNSSGAISLSASQVEAVFFNADSFDSENLDASIDEVLQRREFVWRFPKETMEEEGATRELEIGWLKSLLETLERWKEQIEHWLERVFNSEERSGQTRNSYGFPGVGSTLSYLLIFAFVVALAYFVVRAWRMHKPIEAEEMPLELKTDAVPDLNDEDVAADQLPRNRWVEIAKELIVKGEFRLALRAYFLAQLSSLASDGLVVIRLAKSNREYADEISCRAHGQTDLLKLYRREMRLFEGVWYGDHPIGKEEIIEMENYLSQTGVLV